MVLVECTRFVVIGPFVGDECGIDPPIRPCVCVDMCLFRGKVCRSTSIGVDCLLSILCIRIGFARILDNPSYLFRWLVLWTLGFYCLVYLLGCNPWCWCFPGYPFVGGFACLCCAADLSTGMGISVFHDWVTCNNCTWVYPVLLWLVYRPGLDGSCQCLGGPVFV